MKFDKMNDSAQIPPDQGEVNPLSGGEQPGIPPETLKSALKAFRKRLKVTQLDASSKLSGNRPTTKGGASVVAISPPNQFPRAVWDELAKQGKLRYAGSGLFELLEP